MQTILIKSEAEKVKFRPAILDLKPNKSVNFKTDKGVLGVFFKKKGTIFGITLDGHMIEEVPTAEAAIMSVLSLYEGLRF